jgi:Abnormal spindle-like microcephaly-assoc'd, ASPM-SPD-2-Hydin
MRSNYLKTTMKTAVLLATVLLFGAGLAVGQQQVNLTAAPSTVTLPDGSVVPMWGYFCGPATGSTASCAALNSASAATTTTPATWSPVVITVPTGQMLQINLINNLAIPTGSGFNLIPTSLTIVGQLGGGLGNVAQRTTVASPSHENMGTTWPIANTGAVWAPPGQGPRVQSFGTEVAAVAPAAGQTGTALTWTAPRPGTYLLESGTHPSVQGPMGLYGIVVVTAAASSTTAGCAYPGATAGSCAVPYNAEIPLLFSEIDPVQNNDVNAAASTVGFSESATRGPYAPSPVGSIQVISGGSGYQTTPPTVVFGTAGGSGATATAVVDTDPTSPTYGQVTGVNMLTGGTYTSAPIVTLTGGSGSGATANAALILPLNSVASCSAGAAACYPPAVNYTPLYYLINGVAFDKTKNTPTASVKPSLFATSPATGLTPGTGTVLVRMVNAGLRMHVPSIVGSLTTPLVVAASTTAAPVPGFSLVAEDGNPLPGVSRVQSEVFMAAGKTYDVTINVPTSTTATAALPVYDRELSLSGNAIARDAGMLAYISINGAGVPTAPVLAAAQANPDIYNSLIAGRTLTVSDPSKGVLANDLNVYGVQLLTQAVSGTVILNANGTFSYVPSGTATSDLFRYCANGSVTAGICSSGLTASVTLGAAPIEAATGITCNVPNPTYTSTVATTLSIKSPGVLAFCKDAAGYPLTVNAASVSGGLSPSGTVSVDANGGFNASVAGAGSYTFSFQAQNSQGTLSAGTATVRLVFPTPSNLQVTVMDGKDKTTPVSDYRWIIEEDRSFYVNPNCSQNPPPAGCPTAASGIVPTFGTNFHTSYMPLIATGCTGPLSCESGQTLLGLPAVCDVGNGVCRTGASQQATLDPGQVHLDPTKRYYISVLPGDAANPFNTGNAAGGHGMGGAPIPCLPVAGQIACSAASTFPPITVLVQPNPFPPSKLSVFVFQDDFPLNGEHDGGGGIDVLAPNEPGLGGFNIILFDDAGGTGDATGQMTYDMFNMPLSNSLAGSIDPNTGLNACPISPIETQGVGGTASPTGITGTIVTCPKYESDGTTLSPLAGQAVVANLMPGRYGVVATPSADRIARGEEWLQTNTLDGQKAHDSFLRIGEPSFFQEYGPAGYHVSIGFANPAIINARKAYVCNGTDPNLPPPPGGYTCNNSVTGTVTTNRMSRTPDQRLYGSGDNSSFAFTQCYVSLGDSDGIDFAFTKCDANGNFTLSGLPEGDWRITIFDQWNDILVDGLSTPVSLAGGASLPLGEIAMNQWQTNIYTKTFFDLNGNGIQDGNEQGLTLVSTNSRFRDGSYSNFNNTDLAGNAGFNEIFPLFSWYVIESDTTRYKTTGIHVVYDAGGPADGSSSCTALGGSAAGACGNSSIASMLANTHEPVPLPTALQVPGARYCASADCPTGDTAGGSTGRVDPPFYFGTEAWQGFSGQNEFVEFAKKPYAAATSTAPAENGGIHGEVIYASTRPFDDPTLLLHTSWTPDVPGVTVNLYQEGTGPDGSQTLTLVDTTKTTSWDDWAQGFYSNGKPYMNCPGQMRAPTSTTPGDLFFFSLYNQPMWLDQYNNGGTAAHTIPNNSQFKCYDGMHNWNQVQPAPYDGAYYFPSVIGLDPTTGKPTGTGSINGTSGSLPGTNCTICIPNPDSSDPYRYGTAMLPAGKYVVEIVVPPGYELVKEEDKNILIGDNYIAPVTQQFAGLGNIFILPDQATVGASYNANNAQNPTQDLGRVLSLPSHEGDTGSVETFWPCVGALRIVPDYISLFPQSGEVAPFAGASRNLCDRKEVNLTDQASVLAKFWIFTSAHVAAHFTGVITDDFTSEFDPFSPQFGEKFSPPNLPISIKDWSGTEVARTYSDHWGAYDGITYSTWEVNPPNPTGYAPTMMVVCMNDPGPIPNPSNPGQMITDPAFNPEYSQFCYEIPFMPGQTQYMDTPVVPTSAFAGAGYNNPDCAYPNLTPAIKEVDGDGIGPWVSAAGHTLTITALGDQWVPNNAYSGPSASTPPYNQRTVLRHYGFGSTGTVALVGSDGVAHNLTGVSWNDTTITGTVPDGVPACPIQQQAIYGGSAASCGELVITAGTGQRSIDTVTVTIGGKPPAHVAASASIQSAIDAAMPGDLIIIDPTCTTANCTSNPTNSQAAHNELLLMWKPVRLQGVGAASSVINANTHPAGKLDDWRFRVDCLFGLSPSGSPTGYDSGCGASLFGANVFGFSPTPNNPQVDRLPLEATVGWTAGLNGNLAELLQEPSLMGALEGAAITVLSKGVYYPTSPWDPTLLAGFPTGTVLFTSSNTSTYCPTSTTPSAVYTSNFWCNPSSIDGLTITDSSQGGGGIFVHGWGHNIEIANNRVQNNTGTLSGGINVGQGEYPPAYMQGSATNAPPGSCQSSPTANVQLPYCHDVNVNVHHNAVSLNSSTGDELFSATPAGAGGVSFCTGSDYYKLNYNWVCGNLSTGDGGGFGHLGFSYNGDIEHNTFLFNQSANPTIAANGGGLIIMGAPDVDPPCGTQTDADCVPAPGSVGPSDGTGPGLVINANLIMGNQAESGNGGGIALQQVNGQDVINFPRGAATSGATAGHCNNPSLAGCLWNTVSLTNNIIVNNVAGWGGAGVSFLDTLAANFVNNTVINNDSTASSGVLFDTVGAPRASTGGSNCATTGPTGAATASCPQVAGLVSMQHSAVLAANLAPLTVTCPAGHGTTGNNGNCKRFSVPLMYNDVLWHNRSFQIGVGSLGAGTLNQQHVVTLFNAAFGAGAGSAAASQTSTGQCVSGSSFWDIGVRGDTGPTNHGSGLTLSPNHSFLSSTAGYGGGVNSAANPAVTSQYCNGSRVPPEATCTSATGLPVPCGWQVPPGIADATVPNPQFNLTPTATVDEGNNWINISWGPLAETSPANVTLGNYTPTAGSPTTNYITPGAGLAYTLAPNLDFFNNARKPGPVDAGAVEFAAAAATAVLSVTGGPLNFGNVPTGTTSAARTLTLQNTGTAAAAGIALAFSSTPPGGFSRPAGAAGGTCGAALPGGASCTINLVFTPTAQGAYNGTLTITANVPVSGSPVVLSGTGVAAVVGASLTPTLWNATCTGALGCGPLAPIQVFTLTNTGNVTLTGITQGGLGGTNANQWTIFRVLSTCGPVGNGQLIGQTSLSPGASCVVTVRFTPTTTGAKGPATLSVTDAAGTQSSTLTGTRN